MVARRVAGEIILVPTKSQIHEDVALYTLDEVAAFLWEQLDGRQNGWDLVQTLLTTYAVEPSQAQEDTCQFLEQLKSIEAIRPSESSGTLKAQG